MGSPVTPAITVITVCQNSVRHIEDCVLSVLNQDYPRLQYIVQDGASTDGTIEVLQRYSDRIELTSEPDHGIAEATNKALARASGDIIATLWADERYCDGALQWAAAALENHPGAGVVYGDYIRINEHSERLGIKRGSPITFEELFCVEKVIPNPAAFISAACLRDVGFYCDPQMTICEDFEMWVRIGLKHPILYVPGVVAEAMVHPDSATCRASNYARFVSLKKYVIERTVASPDTPPAIRKLKSRAVAGLYGWAAEAVIRQDFWQGVAWGLRSVLASPRSALRFAWRRVARQERRGLHVGLGEK